MDNVFRSLKDLNVAYDMGLITLEFYLNERDRLEKQEAEKKEEDD